MRGRWFKRDVFGRLPAPLCWQVRRHFQFALRVGIRLSAALQRGSHLTANNL